MPIRFLRLRNAQVQKESAINSLASAHPFPQKLLKLLHIIQTTTLRSSDRIK